MAPKPLLLTSRDARSILSRCGINPDCDYGDLPSAKVNALGEFAISYRYQKPKGASGSRGRYFHAYLTRLAAKETV